VSSASRSAQQAGNAVIEVYEEGDVAGVPRRSKADVERQGPISRGARHRPTGPRPVPIGARPAPPASRRGRSASAVGRHERSRSNNHVFAGITRRASGDPIIQPGDVDGGSDPGDRIGTLHAYQEIVRRHRQHR
jgi:hypothetical protein